MAKMTYSDKRVLIVDDQRPFLILLRGVVNTLGGQSVVTVQNGESAVVACKKEKFDIIISDLHLGAGRKNGFQLLEELRVRRLIKPQTVFIMVSADSERPVVLGSIEKQPDDYLIKPFSQAQLNNRISKAYAKKKALSPIYERIMEEDILGAIDACRNIIREGTRYRQTCTHLLAELYWRANQYKQAEHMLKPMLEHNPAGWVKLSMARTLCFLKRFDHAINMASEVVQSRELLVDGHDIIAMSYMGKNMPIEAQDAISRSLQLSPLSIERQFHGCDIARANHNFEMLKACCYAIWDLSKRSIHRDVAHLCTYIRSILDAAEHAEDRKDKNRYQQEALLALQRSRNDEVLSRVDEDFDIAIFEDMMSARINFLDGKLIEAKKGMAETQEKLRTKFPIYPVVMAPDSIKVLSDLGDYEEVSRLTDLVKRSGKRLDSNTLYLLESTDKLTQQQKSIYLKHNQLALDFFHQGKFQAAYNEFLKAQKIVPVNTDVALNLLQTILRLLEALTKPDSTLVANCRKNYRLLDGFPLNENQLSKFNGLKNELSKYMGL